MNDRSELEAIPVVWELCALPPVHPRAAEATVFVHHIREAGRVFIARTQHYVLNPAGGWDLEPPGELRDAAWFDEHTFTERGAVFAAARIAAGKLADAFTRS